MVLLAGAVGGVQQHVGRLDVPVHQAVQVGRVQRRRHLGDDADRPVRGQRAQLVDQPADVAALDVAHGDEQHAVAVAGREDRDDVRVVHRGRGPRFADEPLPERLVPAQHGRQQLQGDVAAQLDVAGAVDQRHAAPADLLLQPVTGHLGADRVRLGIWVVPPGHSASPSVLRPWISSRAPRTESTGEAGGLTPMPSDVPHYFQPAARPATTRADRANYTPVIYPHECPQVVDNSLACWANHSFVSTFPVGKTLAGRSAGPKESRNNKAQ